MATKKVIAAAPNVPHALVATYVTGFLFSLYLSIFAYVIVVRKVWSPGTLLWVIAGLAVIQFIVQAVCFLHLGVERKPRWKLGVFVSMITIVLILVVGSIWIMDNLNYHMMTPAEEKTYLHNNEGL